jgi:hypothetical protein
VYVIIHLQIEISRNYGPNEWREDLKRFCRRAGAENKPCVFLFSDTQVTCDHCGHCTGMTDVNHGPLVDHIFHCSDTENCGRACLQP